MPWQLGMDLISLVCFFFFFFFFSSFSLVSPWSCAGAELRAAEPCEDSRLPVGQCWLIVELAVSMRGFVARGSHGADQHILSTCCCPLVVSCLYMQ